MSPRRLNAKAAETPPADDQLKVMCLNALIFVEAQDNLHRIYECPTFESIVDEAPLSINQNQAESGTMVPASVHRLGWGVWG